MHWLMALLLSSLSALLSLVEAGPTPICMQKQGKASIWVSRGPGDPLTVKLSETLTILIRVEGEAPLEVELTQKIRPAPGWYLEAIGKPVLVSVEKGPAQRWEQTMLATPLQPGPHPLRLPALQFTEKGGPEQKVTWEPLQLTITTRVAKVDPSEAREPTGIEELPPLPAAIPWWPWLVLVGVAGTAVVALLIWRRRRRRSTLPLPSPSLAALKELKELDAMIPASTEDAKKFYTRLSDVLRHYLEKRFSMPATRWTTTESSAALASVWPQNGVQKEQFVDILRICDLAKYAGAVPAANACQRLVTIAREFVEGTAEPVDTKK